MNGDPVAMESPIKVAPVDQFTPLNCTALTNMGYEPKFVNDTFAFRETVAEMWQCLDRTKAETAEKKPPEPMITDEHHQEALAATQTPMFASKSSGIQVAPIPGVEFIDAAKYRAYLGIKEDQGEEVITASAGPMAQAPQDMAAIKTTPTPAETTTCKGDANPQHQGDANPQCDPTHLCEALGEMNNSLEHLKEGYFKCFHETVKATREVLADLNEVDATYVDTVLEVMRKWQADITLAIMDMHTDNCVVWDAKCNAINEATWKFGQTCKASRIMRANAHEAHQKAVVEGDEKDPVVELLDLVLEKTRKAANFSVKAFQKQFEEVLVPRVPAEHLPILVSNAYNTVSQFRMTIW